MDTTGYRDAPTLPGHPLLGSLGDLRRDYLGTVSRAAREVGPLTRIVAGPPGWRTTLFVVASPELAAEVLSRPDRYRKDAPGYRELRGALGDNVLTSQDDDWDRQRRFLAPVFGHRRIATTYAEVMVDEARRLVRRWETAAGSGALLDAYAEMTEVTARVIGRILFGADVGQALAQIRRFRVINAELLKRAVNPHPFPRWLPTPANRRLSVELAAVRGVVVDLIAQRRTAGRSEGPPDLLGLLLDAQTDDSQDHRPSDTDVVDQSLVFLVAGHETTAVTLACALSALAAAPSWQDVVRRELQEVLDGGLPTADDLRRDRLPWTGRVVRETMRLYPAAHGMARSARQDEVLGGYRIPAGSWVEVSPWAVHHSPAVWPDPERFDPGRFDPEQFQPQRHSWFPFGVGPRSCSGMQVALLEAQIVLAAVLQSYSLSTPLGSPRVRAAITLQPSGVLPLRIS